MDFRQLAALTAVAEHRSFSSAAVALHTVQSNVSAHVARLEREVGTTLIDRATGSLTHAGELVVARARRIQAELDALVGDIASSSEEVVGSVRLGLIGTTGRWLAPLLLPVVYANHPKVHLVLIDATTTSLLPQLHTGQIDLAIVNLPTPDPDIVSMVLFDENHVIVAPEGHPLCGRTTVTVAELAEHALLLPPPGTAYRDELDAEAERSAPRTVVDFAHTGTFDLLQLRRQYPQWLGAVDAVYGSGVYLPLVDQGHYAVSLMRTGALVARPDEATAQRIGQPFGG